ncbi:MAG: GTP-binding protein [Xanthomonadales bacterium]|nr:GTP-binding protein [Gammaproteobacteria bacterium]NNE04783.1 GTP-binding protein [Xanthomonadales bacterium]NNL95474.1 GTP-binding protein [Xanthomonadales bacterium]
MVSRKICLLGDFSVGKTSLVRRFVHEVYDDRYVTTLGVKIETKEVALPDGSVKLVIWDMEGTGSEKAGDDLVTPRMKAYLQGVNGVLIVADGTRKATVETALELHRWLETEYPGLPSVLMLNKADLEDEWKLSGEDIDGLPDTLHSFTTSALSGDNVEDTFMYFAQELKSQA